MKKRILIFAFASVFSLSFSQKATARTGKTPKIKSVYWAIGNKKVKQIEEYQQDLVNLYVKTRNIAPGEEISVTVEETDNSYLDGNKKNIHYTGVVGENGIAEMRRE